jgi:hypothetical protein
VSRGPLVYDRERQELVSAAARLAYPIRDGIPILLADEARGGARVSVEAAARRITDAELHVLAFVEIGDRLGSQGLGHGSHASKSAQPRDKMFHMSLLR